MRVGAIQCVGCGWRQEVWGILPTSEIPALVRDHLTDCDDRFQEHPMFGFEPRWTSSLIHDGQGPLRVMEIGWNRASWGAPLNLDAA